MTDNFNKKIDIDRAWKDEEYPNTLSPEQLAQIPAKPAVDVEIGEAEMYDVSGGALNSYLKLRGGDGDAKK